MSGQRILLADKPAFYAGCFNQHDDETTVQHVSNAAAPGFLAENIPLFECSDLALEEMYYFRLWVYRKHLKSTADGFIITEFLPDVYWAGKHNSINAPLGHHLYEGRWLRNSPDYLEDYIRFWFGKDTGIRSYSTWMADGVLAYAEVTGHWDFATAQLDDLVANFHAWEKSNRHDSGLFWSDDDRDGMECSISGPGLRPTLNSYLFGDAQAIAELAACSGRLGLQDEFLAKAQAIKIAMMRWLWDEQDQFFKAIPLANKDMPLDVDNVSQVAPNHRVRELLGLIPWYFNLPDPDCAPAWRILKDEQAFAAPFGPCTAERSHPRFMEAIDHECLWNGPSWPFATAQTLTALIRLLNGPPQKVVTPDSFWQLLQTYTRSQYRRLSNGRTIPWIDENLDPFSGEWLSRRVLEARGWPAHKGGYERGKDYNHSSYIDLIITGLVGLQPTAGNLVTINPLIPSGVLSYFRVDRLRYRGHEISISFDSDGRRYQNLPGLWVTVDGKAVAHSNELRGLTIEV